MLNDSGVSDTDKAYIAGLFDGEGSIYFKRGIEKKKKHKGKGYRLSNSMRISMQYKWRCTFRDAYYVCCLIWPWSHTKLEKVQQIIQHYSDHKLMNGKVVDLNEYRKAMSLE